jgi:hypothetical protein
MQPSERLNRIPAVWRHAFQFAAAALACVALGAELIAFFPTAGAAVSREWTALAYAVSGSPEALIDWVSWAIGGIAAAVGVFFAVLRRQ